MVAIISPDSHQKKVILPGSYWTLKWGKQTMYFRLPTEAAASGYRYGCVGLRIRLRWVKDSIVSGCRYDCVGLRIRLHRVTQSAVLADWATWVVWLSHLSNLLHTLACKSMHSSFACKPHTQCKRLSFFYAIYSTFLHLFFKKYSYFCRRNLIIQT